MAQWAKVDTKPLLRVAGSSLFLHPLRALVTSNLFGAVRVLAQNSTRLAAELGAQEADGIDICFQDCGNGIAESIAALVRDTDDGPFLVTTADHALLTPEIVSEFVAKASGADLAVGFVERQILLAAYPRSHRTWLRFRGGAYSGANLFWIGSKRALPLIELWRDVEKDRKRGWKVIGAFGPLALAGTVTRILSLEGAFAHVSRRFKADVRPIPLSQAEACIDVDTVEDLRLVEQILANRLGRDE